MQTPLSRDKQDTCAAVKMDVDEIKETMHDMKQFMFEMKQFMAKRYDNDEASKVHTTSANVMNAPSAMPVEAPEDSKMAGVTKGSSNPKRSLTFSSNDNEGNV